jgi:tetratricopeptide (TPR) repeat protein
LKGKILTLQGIIQYQLEHYQSARDYFEDAILVYHTRGDQRGCLKPFFYIGLMYHYQGNYDAARDYFEQALLLARNVGDREIEAQVLSGLGIVRCYLGDYDTARSYLSHSLEIREEIGNQIGQVDSFNKLGIVYHFLGQHRTSQRYCDLALNILQTVNYKEGECDSLTYLGHAQAELGLLEEALASYQKALAVRQEMKQQAATIDILAGLARVALAQENLQTALGYVDDISDFLAINKCDGIDDVLQVYDTMYGVLEMAGADDPSYAEQARNILHTANAILQDQLALIGDRALRRIFLENVALNQKIRTIWKKQAETE